jgi:hypothetical protein
MSGTRGPLKSVRPSTKAATSAITVLKRYMATIRRPCTGRKPKTRVGGKSAPMIST